MRHSSLDRLSELPEVFTTKTLAGHLKSDLKAASVYISRWKSNGLISSLGLRSGVHFNLLKNPNADIDYSLDAVSYLFPSAVVAGVSAVHDAGCTTQIPSNTEIYVPYQRSLPELKGFSIKTRPKAWFTLARDQIAVDGAVPTLTPEFCLADLWITKEWRADPDDIEWDMIDPENLKACFDLFKIEIPDLWMEDYLEISEEAGSDEEYDDPGMC